MSVVRTGDAVRVHYAGRLDDGTPFDSSEGREPLAFTVGEGKVIPGFEKAVLGMAPGERKTVSIAPDDAYGTRRDELVAVLKKEHLPPGVKAEVGTLLQMKTQEGAVLPVRVTAVHEGDVTLDANPPLAGHRLTFDIELVTIGG